MSAAGDMPGQYSMDINGQSCGEGLPNKGLSLTDRSFAEHEGRAEEFEAGDYGQD